MFFKEKYRIPSTRLAVRDYSSPGQYFVTLCTKGHACFFGTVQEDRVIRSKAGEIVAEEWQRTAALRRNVTLDEWQIMPNHLHGIIVICREASPGRLNDEVCRDASPGRLRNRDVPPAWRAAIARRDASPGRFNDAKFKEPETPQRGVSTITTFQRNVSTSRLQAQSLGAIIGQFKGASTKRIRAAGIHDFAWQTRYYDHVIRNPDSLEKIRAYIRHNPLMWDSEKDDPENIRL